VITSLTPPDMNLGFFMSVSMVTSDEAVSSVISPRMPRFAPPPVFF